MCKKIFFKNEGLGDLTCQCRSEISHPYEHNQHTYVHNTSNFIEIPANGKQLSILGQHNWTFNIEILYIFTAITGNISPLISLIIIVLSRRHIFIK
jgi:hypothetical protein